MSNVSPRTVGTKPLSLNQRGQLRFRELAETGRKGVQQRFPPLRERSLDRAEKERFVADLADRLGAHREFEHGGRDLRLRDEAARRNIEQQLRHGVILAEDRKCAIIPFSGGRGDALRDLLLHHDRDRLERAGLQQGGQNRRCNIVWQVRAGDGAQTRNSSATMARTSVFRTSPKIISRFSFPAIVSARTGCKLRSTSMAMTFSRCGKAPASAGRCPARPQARRMSRRCRRARRSRADPALRQKILALGLGKNEIHGARGAP